jgi:hypothetical protein
MTETVKKVRFAWIRKVLLRRVVGYSNEQRYWNSRWAWGKIPRNPNYRSNMEAKVRKVMLEHGCKNILEIGCGEENLKGLPNYTGLDFSLEGLKKSKLDTFIFADITKRIPLPDKCFDAAFTSGVLQHIRPENVQKAASEMARVAKLVILDEPHTDNPTFFSWDHNYEELFRGTLMVYVTEKWLL